MKNNCVYLSQLLLLTSLSFHFQGCLYLILSSLNIIQLSGSILYCTVQCYIGLIVIASSFVMRLFHCILLLGSLQDAILQLRSTDALLSRGFMDTSSSHAVILYCQLLLLCICQHCLEVDYYTELSDHTPQLFCCSVEYLWYSCCCSLPMLNTFSLQEI